MILLSAKDLALSFGTHTLFNDLEFEIQEGEKIGLIGVNGSGKTSLFKLITGELQGDGQIFRSKSLSLGYMQQHVNNVGKREAYAEVLDVFSPLMEMEGQMEDLVIQLSGENIDLKTQERLILKQAGLHEAYEDRGGLTYRSRARATLLGLGFDEDMLTRPMEQLSGGEKSKVLLARLLLSGANLLLLDEPTNHLDIAAVEWLESYINNYAGAVVVISHDRYFLDKVTRRTFELENGKLHAYNGNYSTYMKKKEKADEVLARHYANTMKEIKRIEGIVEQQRRWNRERNIRTAESKLKQIDRLKKDLVAPEKAPDSIAFSFHCDAPSGQEVLDAENLKKSFDGKTLFSNISFHLQAGERVFLLGPNGSGKSTLLKMLLNKIPYDSGIVELGAGVKVGYYDQTMSNLVSENSALDEIWRLHPDLTQTEARNALAAFLFRGDDVFKPISALSGGERARVALLNLMLSGCNFLLLDEPTNHLDIPSREMLEEALMGYEGTQLIVSHDRYFINKLADRILSISSAGLEQSLGNYDDYLLGQERQAELYAEQSGTREDHHGLPKNDYQLERERKSEKRRLIGQRNRAEDAVKASEAKVKALQDDLCRPEIATDFQAAHAVSLDLEAEQANLDALYEKWMGLMEECEAFEAQDT